MGSRGTGPLTGESRKSAGDRRMERLEIVKNPFDPSLKADSSTASARINTDSGAISGMNPPAPEPSSQTGSSSKPGGGGEVEEEDLAPTMQRCCNTSSTIRNNWDQTTGRLSDEGIMIMNQIIEKLT